MNPAKRQLCSQRHGSATALALLALVILSVIGTGLLTLSQHSQLLTTMASEDIKARCAADAGMTRAIYEMNEKLKVTPWDDSELPSASNVSLPNASATYTFAVTGDAASGYTVQATGTSSRATRTIQATLKLQGLFEYVLFADEKIIRMANHTTIDGYNSEDGLYGGINSLKPIYLGTNSIANKAIKISHCERLYGDVIVGVNGHFPSIIAGLGKITGDAYAAIEPKLLPEIIPPTLSDKGDLDIDETTTLREYDSGKYEEVEIENGTVIIEGDVVLNFSGQTEIDNARIEIGENASLILYLADEVEAENPGFVDIRNLTKNPAKLKIYGTSENSYNLGSGNEFYGVIYTPYAYLHLYSDGDIYGAFVADKIEQHGSGDIHYDEAVQNTNFNDPGLRFCIKHWQE